MNNLILYHLSENISTYLKLFEPRIPQYLTDGSLEDTTTPRICFSETILGALSASSYRDPDKNYMLFTLDTNDVDEHNIMTPKQLYDNKLVYDALFNKEYWIINQTLELEGNIISIGDIERDFFTAFCYDTETNRDLIYDLYSTTTEYFTSNITDAIDCESMDYILNTLKHEVLTPDEIETFECNLRETSQGIYFVVMTDSVYKATIDEEIHELDYTLL